MNSEKSLPISEVNSAVRNADKPAANTALTQDLVIAEALIDDIIDGVYLPGAWLREREIANRFGVSHAPVREAFRHVARAGFVQVVPWRGAHVVEFGLELATETFEVWKAMFGVICRLAAQRMTPAHHFQLIRLLEDFELAVAAAVSPQEHSEAARKACRYIADSSGAPVADEVFRRVCALARWQKNLLARQQPTSSLMASAKASARQFRILCSAIIARAPDQADEYARQFLAISQSHITEFIALRD